MNSARDNQNRQAIDALQLSTIPLIINPGLPPVKVEVVQRDGTAKLWIVFLPTKGHPRARAHGVDAIASALDLPPASLDQVSRYTYSSHGARDGLDICVLTTFGEGELPYGLRVAEPQPAAVPA